MGEIRIIPPDQFGDYFLKEAFSEIYSQTTEEFKQIVTLEQFIEQASSFNMGVEEYRLECRTKLNKLVTQYVWVNGDREKAICVLFDKHNTIYGLRIAPFASYPEKDQCYTKNAYSMPIKDEWFVFWGGTNQFINYHYVYETQRYAYDLIVMKNGQSYRDSPHENENYYAYNKEITAPASGTVVKVVEGVADNKIGECDETEPAGNYVILAHNKEEFSLLAHLKCHSIVVKKNDRVQEGQVIGRCGNSGNSTEPHLHFQIMNAPDIMEGHSIRIRFKDGTQPIQGDTV